MAWTSAVPWIGQACHSGAMALSHKSWRRHARCRPGAIQEEIFNLLNAPTPSGPSATESQPSRRRVALGRDRTLMPSATGLHKKPLCDVAHSSEMEACPKLKPIIVA